MKKYLYIVIVVIVSMTGITANAQTNTTMTLSPEMLASLQQQMQNKVKTMSPEERQLEAAKVRAQLGLDQAQPKKDVAVAIVDFMNAEVTKHAEIMFGSDKVAEALKQIPVQASGDGYTKYMYSVAIPSQSIPNQIEWRSIKLQGEMVRLYKNKAFAVQQIVPINGKQVAVWLPLKINEDLTVKQFEKNRKKAYQQQLNATGQQPVIAGNDRNDRATVSDWMNGAFAFAQLGTQVIYAVDQMKQNRQMLSGVQPTQQYYATQFVQGATNYNAVPLSAGGGN